MKRVFSREMVVVLVILALGTLAYTMLQPVLPLYLTDIGVSPAIVGLMFSMAMVGMVIGESSWGWVADRMGLKIPLSAGTFACAIVVFFFVVAQHTLAIFTIFFFWGVVRSAIFGPIRGYIGAKAPPAKKATFMAVLSVILATSRSVGALPSGFIADTWGYRWVFLISTAIALLGGIIVVVGLRKAGSVRAASPTFPATPTDWSQSSDQRLSYRPLFLQCVVAALQFTGLGILITFLPLLAIRLPEIAATQVGILFTIRGLVTVIAGIPLGILVDRRGKRLFMLLGLLLSAVAMAQLAFTQSFPWFIVFVAVASFGHTMFNPAALCLLSDSVPLHRQSTAMGVYGGVCQNTGIIAGSALGGFIWSAWGPEATFLFGTLTAGIGAVVCLTLISEKRTPNS
jgi:MFS family permease